MTPTELLMLTMDNLSPDAELAVLDWLQELTPGSSMCAVNDEDGLIYAISVNGHYQSGMGFFRTEGYERA